MSQCKIYLENYNGNYYAGGEISGRLECYFREDITVRGIKIRLKCKEHNEWTETESYTDHSDNNKSKTRYVLYTGDHGILSYEQMVFGSDSGSREITSGRHVYPFRFSLPENIPSTFNGPYGSITYSLKGIVDRPMRPDYEDKFIFVVDSPIDFNKKHQDLQGEITYSDDKTICCWCCKGGNLTAEVALPKEAFVVGEQVPIKVMVTNLSNSSVENLRVRFTKRITFEVTSPSRKSKSTEDEFFTHMEHGVGAHGEHTYNIPLVIPEHLEVPNFSLCNLFESTYKLEVSCIMPSCVLDLDVEMYTQLGHIAYNRGQNIVSPSNNGTIGFAHNDIPPMDGTYPPPMPVPYASAPGIMYPPPLPPYPTSPADVPPPYPATAGAVYPPSPAYPGYLPSDDKTVYRGQLPSAPTTSNATAPMADDNPKAKEAGFSSPTAPAQTSPELPPPSYNQAQQSANNLPYPS